MNDNQSNIEDIFTLPQTAKTDFSAAPHRKSSEYYRDYMRKSDLYFLRHIHYKRLFIAMLIEFFILTYLFAGFQDQYLRIAVDVKNRTFAFSSFSAYFYDFYWEQLSLKVLEVIVNPNFWRLCGKSVFTCWSILLVIDIFLEWIDYLKDSIPAKKSAKQKAKTAAQNNRYLR